MLVSLSEAGGIYFITFPNCSDFVKIGQAVCFSKRFAALQTGSPHPLDVELIFPINSLDHKILAEVENMFHSKFSAHRHRGEWFVRSGQLANFIEEKQKLDAASSCSFEGTMTSQVYGWDYSKTNEDHADIKGFGLSASSKASNREIECAIYVSKGYNNTEIAEKMNVSIETIKTFISNLLQKLELTNRTQLAVEAVKREWDQYRLLS